MITGIASLNLTGNPTTSIEGEGTRGPNKSSPKEKPTLPKASQRTAKRAQAGDSPLLPGSNDKGDLQSRFISLWDPAGKIKPRTNQKLGLTLERGSLYRTRQR